MPGEPSEYKPLPGGYDELVGENGQSRAELGKIPDLFLKKTPEDLAHTQNLAELSLRNQGVTFSVHSDQRGSEKIFPFCHIPRILSSSDWASLEQGLLQRLTALELFLADVYGEQKILAAGEVPREMVLSAKFFLPELVGVKPPHRTRIHIAGIDLIRDPQGNFLVLEDNLRTPSGVSYVLENRLVSKRVVPQALTEARVRPVDHYPTRLARILREISPSSTDDTCAVLLTPGPYNSAYFEHAFLARSTGIELVQPTDLYVDQHKVFMRTTRGPQRVHVIYRRIDDTFLDPDIFRSDSLLGIRGLINAYRNGNVALVNAPGNGVADDKAIYAFVPAMIRYYLGEEPKLAQVPTYVCARPEDRAYVLEHLEELVVKSTDETGGRGMLMGPQSTPEQRETFRQQIEADPRRYIAQPQINFSTCPTLDPKTKQLVARRIDLRPYILTGPSGSWVLPGGLTRIALEEGSYIVNSSQGGGSKDTWVQQAEVSS